MNTENLKIKVNRKVLYEPHSGPQTEFFQRKEDIVFYGGSKGGGKSWALLLESIRQKDNPNYKALILRRTFPQLQEILDRAHELFPSIGSKWDAKESRYKFPAGGYIIFGHCQHEEDKRRYQGHEYQFIGFDQLEEFSESQFNFICMQNRTSDPALKCYIRATGNPGGPGHWWVKRTFIDNRTAKKTYTHYFKLPTGGLLTRTQVFIPATIYDNPTLLKANPTYLANLMSLPDAEKEAFLKGNWNIFTSQSIFDAHGMQKQEQLVEDPQWVGDIKDRGDVLDLVLSDSGRLRVFRPYKDNVKYFISADVATGVEDGDYSSAKVFNRATWGLIAKWHGHVDPAEFGEILYSMGEYYNWAEVAVECWPGPGIATLKKLQDKGYSNLYKRWVDDGKGGAKVSQEPGWVTDQRSRYDMLASLQEAVRRGTVIIRDRDTLDEMYNFIRLPNGKTGAREGCFDDQVIDTAIAVHCMKLSKLEEPSQPDSPMTVTNIGPRSKNGKTIGPHWARRRNAI